MIPISVILLFSISMFILGFEAGKSIGTRKTLELIDSYLDMLKTVLNGASETKGEKND